MTFIGLLVGFAVLSYQFGLATQRFEFETQKLRHENQDLARQMENQAFRTRSNQFSTEILLHISNDQHKYPILESCLRDPSGRKVKTFYSPMDDGDNIAHISVYAINDDSAAPILGVNFLVHEEPFEVLDAVAGTPSVIPLFRDGYWVVDTKIDGDNVRYRVDNGKFARE